MCAAPAPRAPGGGTPHPAVSSRARVSTESTHESQSTLQYHTGSHGEIYQFKFSVFILIHVYMLCIIVYIDTQDRRLILDDASRNLPHPPLGDWACVELARWLRLAWSGVGPKGCNLQTSPGGAGQMSWSCPALLSSRLRHAS